MSYIGEFENIFQDLMHKVAQHPLSVLMLETRYVYELVINCYFSFLVYCSKN